MLELSITKLYSRMGEESHCMTIINNGWRLLDYENAL